MNVIKAWIKKKTLLLRLWRIEKATKTCLTEEQKAYILNNDNSIMHGPRGNGKSNANFIKILLLNKTDISCEELEKLFNNDTDYQKNKAWHIRHMRHYNLLCKNKGIKVFSMDKNFCWKLQGIMR